VTILFADLVSSTAMTEQLDAETVRWAMDRYFDAARQAIEHHGGVVEKFIGDAVMAVFGVPRAHEDDALRAARCALELRDRLAILNAELSTSRSLRLQIRTGICTGEVVAGSPERGERFVTGDAVNVAARLEQVAEPGTILLAEATHRMLRDAVRAEPVPPLQLKGKSGSVRGWRLIEVAEGAEPLPRHFETPFVGRTEELSLLAEVFERTQESRSPQLVTVLGEPGVGKTRLVQEAVTMMGPETTVLRGRVQAYGERVALRPFVEMLEALGADSLTPRLLGIPGGDRAALTLGRLVRPDEAEADMAEVPQAARLLVEALGQQGPLVLVIDDVHWAQPPMLDLVEHLVASGRDTRLLVICIARPELLDSLPGSTFRIEDGITIELGPLEHDLGEALVENLLGHHPVDASLVARVTQTCEGNPLFLEQFMGSLLDEGSLRHERARWVMTRDLQELPTPATVTAVLEARLERLPGPERELLERGAVEGMRFHDEFVRELTAPEARSTVDATVQGLIHRGLIRRDQPFVPGYRALRFAHVLIHDAAYARATKAARAADHERYAYLLAAACAPLGIPVEGAAGWHLERAYQLLGELGISDAHVRSLGRRAGVMLESAGHRAEDRGDVRAAYDLFVRASRLPVQDARELGHRLLDASFHGRQIDVPFTELLRLIGLADRVASDTGDSSLAVRVRAQRSEVVGSMAEHQLPYDRAAEAEWLERALEDPSLETRSRDEARWSLWCLRMDQGNMESLYRIAEQILVDAEAQGSTHRRRRATSIWATTAWVARLDAPRDIGRIRSLAEQWRSDPLASFQLAETEVLLLALMGRHDEALEARARQRAIAREVPGMHDEGDDPGLDALVAGASGDLEAAVRHQRATVDRVDARGAGGYASSSRFELARLLLRIGRPHDIDEAAALIAEARHQHLPGDMLNEIYIPECLSLLAARRGDSATAVREARTAVSVADTTGWIWRQADARVVLAFALGTSGAVDEAEGAVREACSLYAQSGLHALADRAREFIEPMTLGRMTDVAKRGTGA
jgi:class 3 adenylate cyclase